MASGAGSTPPASRGRGGQQGILSPLHTRSCLAVFPLEELRLSCHLLPASCHLPSRRPMPRTAAPASLPGHSAGSSACAPRRPSDLGPALMLQLTRAAEAEAGRAADPTRLSVRHSDRSASGQACQGRKVLTYLHDCIRQAPVPLPAEIRLRHVPHPQIQLSSLPAPSTPIPGKSRESQPSCKAGRPAPALQISRDDPTASVPSGFFSIGSQGDRLSGGLR